MTSIIISAILGLLYGWTVAHKTHPTAPLSTPPLIRSDAVPAFITIVTLINIGIAGWHLNGFWGILICIAVAFIASNISSLYIRRKLDKKYNKHR